MDTIKIVKNFFISGLTGLLLLSCGGSSEETQAQFVSKEKYETKIAEYKQLNDRMTAIVDDNIEKSHIVNDVVRELRQLTGATYTLRQNIESGGASQITQADEINQRLEILKQRLSEVKSVETDDNDASKNLLSTIANLQQIIAQKEKEIAQLKQQIQEKDETIRSQRSTIDLQQAQLAEQQKETWFKLGESLYNAAIELPNVKGPNDKRKQKKARRIILGKAMECFHSAKQLGHTRAESMYNKVKKEIERL